MTIRLIKRDQPPVAAEEQTAAKEQTAAEQHSDGDLNVPTEDDQSHATTQTDSTTIDETLRTLHSWVKEFRDRRSGKD